MIIHYKDKKEEICQDLIKIIKDKLSKNKFHLAISGGSTPRLLFELWAQDTETNWQNLFLYWVDERCVLPTDNESNYLMTYDTLLSKVPIPKEQVYRIRGEADYIKEAERYSKQAISLLPITDDGFPIFDIVLLGIGNDGHTSSIFPDQMDLLTSNDAYDIAHNPYNKQKRIAMTGPTILAAKDVIFLVTGESKRKVLHNIISNNIEAKSYPSQYIIEHRCDAQLYTDLNNI